MKSLVFDGLPENIVMANSLGANLELGLNFKHWIQHQSTEENVYIMLDACHMLKLIRGLIGDEEDGVVIPGFTSRAKWDHFKALHDDQESIGLRAGNRLTKNHVNYHRHKMKVIYAGQVLSQSVANALDFAKEDGSNPRLADCEATSFFARQMDVLFDFCNSRSPKATETRAPITKENYEERKVEIMKIIHLLQTIKVDKKTKLKGKTTVAEVFVKDRRRRTGIIGFSATVHSIFDLARELLDDPSNRYQKVKVLLLIKVLLLNIMYQLIPGVYVPYAPRLSGTLFWSHPATWWLE